MASISITAPSSAEEGERVSVYVWVTNTRAIGYIFKIEIFAVPDIYPHYFIFRGEDIIYGGSSKGYSALLTMPDCNTTILVNVERWENDRWNYEGTKGKVVSLEVPVPEPEPEPVEGTIIRKELEYSGSGDGTVPVADVPQGVSAKLHVWGRNDMSISQGMGIYWFVADPEGFVAEEYSDWGGTIGAGKDHEFISSGSFDLNKVGKYTTWIELLMGTKDNPKIVDRYIGDLCTVVAELVPTFSELKISSFEKK